ncbi:MAG: pyruvate kinase [bacterium]
MDKLIKTKIVATLGPASNSEERMAELIKAGVRIFRVNTSHGTPEFHKGNIELVRKVSKDLNIFVSILLDLQGPKIRVGNLKAQMDLVNGEKYTIKPMLETDEPNVIPVDYAGIANDVQPGDKVLLNDGKIGLKALAVRPGEVDVEVIYGGPLTSRKGLNIPGTTASLSAVTERDVTFIKFGVENNVDYIALSFVRTRDDIILAKKYINDFGGEIPIIAKIEKPQAVENLNSIIAASEGVMVARGDLGIEISPEKVPLVQKRIIDEANAQRRAVITATQMLESMIESPIPTRAEASDVANAILDGSDAVMLSAETAVGAYPVEAVSMMSMIAENIESSTAYKSNQYADKAREIYELDSQAIATSVIRMVNEVEVNAIVAFTRSGYTGRLLSKAKPSVPIFAITDREEVCRRLALFWDVYPFCIEYEKNFTEDLLKKLDDMLIDQKLLNPGDKIIITGGLPEMAVGRTNFIRLHQVGSTRTNA